MQKARGLGRHRLRAGAPQAPRILTRGGGAPGLAQPISAAGPMERQCARARRMFTQNSPSELPRRPPPSSGGLLAPVGTGPGKGRRGSPVRAPSPPRSAAAAPHTPAAASSAEPRRRRRRAARPARPPCRLSRRETAADARSHSAGPRQAALLPWQKERKKKNYRAHSRSRGGRHTNSAGRLPLPGPRGVVTPRRRSGRERVRASERARALARVAAGKSPGEESRDESACVDKPGFQRVRLA